MKPNRRDLKKTQSVAILSESEFENSKKSTQYVDLMVRDSAISKLRRQLNATRDRSRSVGDKHQLKEIYKKKPAKQFRATGGFSPPQSLTNGPMQSIEESPPQKKVPIQKPKRKIKSEKMIDITPHGANLIETTDQETEGSTQVDSSINRKQFKSFKCKVPGHS